MGLGSFLSDIIDPAGLFSGKEGTKAAEEARDITNEELRRQFGITQENLRPALEAAQRQLPGIGEQLDPSQFGATLGALRPELEAFLDPTRAKRSAAGLDILSSAGLSPGGVLPGGGDLSADLGKIDASTFADLLIGAEADLFGNRLALSGLGQGAGGVLSELGQRTGAGIAQANIDAATQSGQAQAAGTQNLLGGLGLLASFFSDENLKENIEHVGNFHGLKIIRWTWKDFVPESWKDIEIGFSAQEILEKYPTFVTEINGYLSINRNRLMRQLEYDHG